MPARIPVDPDTVGRMRIALARIARRLRATSAGAGLTATELSVLFSVARQEKIRLSDLAAVESVNPTMLSRIVGRLVELALVRRTCDERDRRVVLVAITERGRQMHERIRAERTQALLGRLERLPDEQVTTLLAALPGLEALADSLEDRLAGNTPGEADEVPVGRDG